MPDNIAIPLDDVLITEELEQRPARNADYALENRAILALSEITECADDVLNRLAEVAVDVSGAQSAVVSVCESAAQPIQLGVRACCGRQVVEEGHLLDQNECPCGLAIAYRRPLLFARPERHFQVLDTPDAPLEEYMVLPLMSEGKPFGTLCVATHSATRQFDAEDVRMLQSLGRIAADRYQLLLKVEQHQSGHGVAGSLGDEGTTESTTHVRFQHDASERFRRAREVEAVGIILFRSDGRITEANDAFLRMSGYSRHDLERGLIRWNVMTPEEFIPATRSVVEELFTYGLSTTYEQEYIRKDGTRWWGLFTGTRVSEDEAIEYILDITDMRETQAQLDTSEKLFQALVQTTSDALYRMSPDWIEMYELESEGFLKRTPAPRRNWLEDYIHPDDQQEVLQVIQEAIDAKRPFELEHRVWQSDGTLGWVNSRAVPVLNQEGEIAFWFGAGSDVTDRRQAEEERRENETRLAERVAVATRQLRALSQRLLRVQERERRHLAYELHDEIGQTLTGLTFTLEMAKRTHDNEFVLQAQSITGHLSEQVRAITLELRPSALDDLGLVPALLALAEAMPARTGLHVELFHEGDRSRFPSDVEIAAYRITQEALTNVARHAGTDRATVRIIQDGHLVVWIADNGAGFDVDAARASGLSSGLASMQERASLVGGELSVDSVPGEGTTVIFELKAESGSLSRSGEPT